MKTVWDLVFFLNSLVFLPLIILIPWVRMSVGQAKGDTLTNSQTGPAAAKPASHNPIERGLVPENNAL